MDSVLQQDSPPDQCNFWLFADKIWTHNCRDLLVETIMTSTDQAMAAELILMPTMIFGMISMSMK